MTVCSVAKSGTGLSQLFNLFPAYCRVTGQLTEAMKRAAAFSVAFLLSGIHAEGAPKQYPVTKVPSPVVELKTIDERRSPKESIRHGTSDVGYIDLFWVRSMIWRMVVIHL